MLALMAQVATSAKSAGGDFFGPECDSNAPSSLPPPILDALTVAGLAIGFTVGSMAITVGGVSGGAFNPAVGLLALVSAPATGIPSGVWIYWVAPPLAGLLAGIVFRITNAPEFVQPEDCPRETNGKYKRQKRHTNLYGEPDPDVSASFNAFFPPVDEGVEVAKYDHGEQVVMSSKL